MLKHFPDRLTAQAASDPILERLTNATTVIPETQHSTDILTRCAGQILCFPAVWVMDILVVERSKILRLPFYPEALLGVVHYQAKVVPLVTLNRSVSDGSRFTQSSLMAVRLAATTGPLQGVAVVVEQLLGHASEADIGDPSELGKANRFQLSDIPSDLWQPLAYAF